MRPEQFAPLILIFIILIVVVFFIGILRTLGGGKIILRTDRRKLFYPRQSASFLGVLEQVVGGPISGFFGKIRLGDYHPAAKKGVSNEARGRPA